MKVCILSLKSGLKLSGMFGCGDKPPENVADRLQSVGELGRLLSCRVNGVGVLKSLPVSGGVVYEKPKGVGVCTSNVGVLGGLVLEIKGVYGRDSKVGLYDRKTLVSLECVG